MKTILLLIVLQTSSHFAFAKVLYTSPKNGSVMINVEHNIIIREDRHLDQRSLVQASFSIMGEKSGSHDFKVTLCDDGRTVLLDPVTDFEYAEKVTVLMGAGIRTSEGSTVEGHSFSFTTHREYSETERKNFTILKERFLSEELNQTSPLKERNVRNITGLFAINVNTNPSPGDIFFDSRSAFNTNNEYSGYHAITTAGDSVFSANAQYSTDFNVKQNGYLGVYNRDKLRYDVFDSNFNVIDKYYPVNGYEPDEHELLLLPDGHAIIIADEFQIIDMRFLDSSYSSACTVNSTVIQEFDANHNLVFEWRSFDYISIPEAKHTNLAAEYVDFVHTNSVEIDHDGHIIASHRRLDQVTKIDRTTGEFIWRMGGEMNEFTFISEPEPFNYQHDARRLANGNILLYDNGNYHAIPHSTAKEYQLDEVNKTATLVWSYTHPNPNGGNPLFYTAMGSAQRLSTGNTLINWGWRGNGTDDPAITEVTPAGTIVWELTLTTEDNMVAYRARKAEWDPCARPTFKKMETKDITAASAKVKWAGVSGAITYKVQYKKHSEETWSQKSVQASKNSVKLSNLEGNTKYDWRIETWCSTDDSKTSGFTDFKKFTTLSLKQLTTQEIDSEDFLIYPNPVQDHFIIQCKVPMQQVTIYNLTGQKIMEKILSDEVSNQIEIATEVPSGNYFVEVVSNSGRRIQKLIIE